MLRLFLFAFVIGGCLSFVFSGNVVNPVKIAIFFELCGARQEPVAKSLVPVILFPLLILYTLPRKV